MTHDDLVRLYNAEQANIKKRKMGRSIYVDSLEKLVVICRVGQLLRPIRKWFKKVCPLCGAKLIKNEIIDYPSPGVMDTYVHMRCQCCNYDWCNKSTSYTF